MATNNEWDVVVVGGGPAGMMAAGRAAQNGAKVLLIEKNNSLGRKLLITGGGRCNVTNSEFDTRKFLANFKDSGKYLFSAFSEFGVKETLDFFHANGMDTKIEAGLRTFPTSDSAQSVLDVLVKNLKKYKVEVLSNTEVGEILRDGKHIVGVKLKNKKIIRGRSYILATGGTSHPETGSTGDGYGWLGNIGHTVISPKPSLVPVALKESWVKNLAGVTLENVKISMLQNGARRGSSIGKVLFTHVGLSGPSILNMSSDIGELLKYGEVELSLDLFPKMDSGLLDKKIQELFKVYDKKFFKNALVNLIPSAIVRVMADISNIDSDIQCNAVSRECRKTLGRNIKDFRFGVKSLLGVDKAIVTRGGVILGEVDFKTMRSRLFTNLYLAGDILDIDRPSGGYSLQLCWTTGYVAGTFAAEK